MPKDNDNDTIVDSNWHKRACIRFQREYAFYLQSELDEFVQPDDRGSSLLRHSVQVIAAPIATVVTVEFVRRERLECWDQFEGWIEKAAESGFTIFRGENGSAIAHKYSDEALIKQRLGVHLHQPEGKEMFLQICHPSAPYSWSNVQAWEDSNDAIALILARRGVAKL